MKDFNILKSFTKKDTEFFNYSKTNIFIRFLLKFKKIERCVFYEHRRRHVIFSKELFGKLYVMGEKYE